ncbi:MAG: arylsulfatase, partial [bacterium]|nr:arylsulfatase [bacterium]
MKVASVVPLILCFLGCLLSDAFADDRPNVIVIMSDDQGGGDYGFLGNEVIRTPNLDAMHKRGGHLSRFYVSPVCAPTRASLMTGRYNYRTRCIDTYIGRAMMDTNEITIAELLRDAGYQTGIYGKWHLGDNYPLRPMDQGFQDSLVHRGGGIGQPSDPIGAEGKYTDPTLIKNGKETPMKGYCTDIYFDAAMQFIEQNVQADKKFFTYIATNAPHGPFHDVPNELYEEYRKVDFSPILVDKMNPAQLKRESDKLARISAMITNIDENVGRLFQKLNELKITDDTIVVYLNDNGPNTRRFVGDMRGKKADVDDGGIRSPLLFHWPAQVKPGYSSDQLCAHIDLTPTILDACQVEPPKDRKIDGRSFLPLLTAEDADWLPRQIVLQSHRGDEPTPFHHFALHEHPWKLVHPSGFGNEGFAGAATLQLYNLKTDPQQRNNVAGKHPEVVQRLKKDYEAWFKDVSSTRPDNFAPPRMIIGTDHEPRSVLTRQDWRHAQGRP